MFILNVFPNTSIPVMHYHLLKMEIYAEKKHADPRSCTGFQKKCKNSVYTNTAGLLFCNMKPLMEIPRDICIFILNHCLQSF